MKHYLLVLLLSCICACNNNTSNNVLVKKTPITYTLTSAVISKAGAMYVSDKKYSGFLYELYPESTDTLSLVRYYNGLKDGKSLKWFKNQKFMESREYSAGKKNGNQVAFFKNGNKRFEYKALNDVYEGEMNEWNSEGLLIHKAHYVNGQEEGAQQLWYDNGKIRANYIIRSGKRYGLLGTKNCVNVSDSIFLNN